jgi:hypothetical protein
MTFQDSAEQFRFPRGDQPLVTPFNLWIDQLAQEILLTAQAFNQLQIALTAKFK